MIIKLSDTENSIVILSLRENTAIYYSEERKALSIDSSGFKQTFSYSTARKLLRDYDKIYKMLFNVKLNKKPTLQEEVDNEMEEFNGPSS